MTEEKKIGTKDNKTVNVSNNKPQNETGEKIIVTAIHDVDFPELGWGINKGRTRQLPDDKKAQEIILANPSIKKKI